MKLSTRVIIVIEMTSEEHRALWYTDKENRVVLGKKVQHWLTDDGNDEMLLEGETTYYPIVIV